MTSPSNGNDLTSDPEVSAVLTATKTLSHGLTQNPLHSKKLAQILIRPDIYYLSDPIR